MTFAIRSSTVQWLLRAALIAIGSSFGILIAEVGLRVANRSAPLPRWYPGEGRNSESGNFVADEKVGWRMRSLHEFHWSTEGREVGYRSDARGQRVSRLAISGAADDSTGVDSRPLLLIAGDSFTFGIGVEYEEIYAVQVAQSLRMRPEIVAQPGYGIDQIRSSVLDRLESGLRPGLVLLAIYREDFTRSFQAFRPQEGFRKPMFVWTGDGFRVRTEQDGPTALWRWCERRSRILAALQSAGKRLGQSRGFGEWFGFNQRLIADLRTQCEARGVPILFVYIPPSDGATFPALLAEMEESGSTCFDPTSLPEFTTDGLYYPQDRHLNAQGHQKLAEWLMAFAAAHGIPAASGRRSPGSGD